jgi:SAM-dependent methyltransferase
MSIYADELFTPRTAHADEFAAVALRVARELPAGARVLDVGCGSGDLIRRAMRPGVSFVGIDISRPNIDAAKAACPSAQFHCEDFLNFEGDRFDVIFANGVLNLIDCPDAKVAIALSQLIKPEGVLVAAIPIDSRLNRILVMQRRLWSLMPNWVDKLIGSASSAVLKDKSLVERLVYLRVPPARLLDNHFLEAMKLEGFNLFSTLRMHADYPLKLQHAIVTWAMVDQANNA